MSQSSAQPTTLPDQVPVTRPWSGITRRISAFFDAPFFNDINAPYAEAMQYPRADRLTFVVLWLHFLVLVLLVLVNVQFKMAIHMPSPLSWRMLSPSEGITVVVLGLMTAYLPMYAYSRWANHYHWRLLVAACLTAFSYFLIFTSGGSMEMHFHIFLVMAYMCVYADWRIAWFMLLMTVVMHLALDILQPTWLYFYGRNDLSPLVHAAYATALALFATLICNNYRGAVVALVSAKQRNDEFLAIASHELKTPLTSMKGYIDVLQRRLKRGDDETSWAYADKVDDQLNKITALVRDLLDVSKIQSGNVEFREEMMSIESLISSSIEDVQALAHKHTIGVEGNQRVMVMGDKMRLRQVMVNLLSNAIKYSPQSDKVIVKVMPTRERVVVSVQDFGIGVADTDQLKIFEPYFRGKTARREDVPGGLGMGLYICAEIVRRHHGRIWVESREGHGATFSFYLPLPRPDERSSAT